MPWQSVTHWSSVIYGLGTHLTKYNTKGGGLLSSTGGLQGLGQRRAAAILRLPGLPRGHPQRPARPPAVAAPSLACELPWGAPGNTRMGNSPQAAGGFLLAHRTRVLKTGRCMLMDWTIFVQQGGDPCAGVWVHEIIPEWMDNTPLPFSYTCVRWSVLGGQILTPCIPSPLPERLS